MPFNRHSLPRIVPLAAAPVDDADELQLPPELAALGQQLGDDARHLANCYPPPSSLPQAMKSKGLRYGHRVLAGLAAAVALAVAVTISTALHWRQDAARPGVASSPAATTPRTLAAEMPAPARPLPGVALGEVSAPELEGLLDLRENSRDVASIAF
jgi:hypothetical protein